MLYVKKEKNSSKCKAKRKFGSLPRKKLWKKKNSLGSVKVKIPPRIVPRRVISKQD